MGFGPYPFEYLNIPINQKIKTQTNSLPPMIKLKDRCINRLGIRCPNRLGFFGCVRKGVRCFNRLVQRRAKVGEKT
jgi:hypothetical protein